MNAHSDPTPDPLDLIDKDHGDEVPQPSGPCTLPVDRKGSAKKDDASLL